MKGWDWRIRVCRSRRGRIALATIALLAVCAAALWGIANRAVTAASAGRTFDNVAEVPPCDAALVLGCAARVRAGWSNAYFLNRIAAAARLYSAGKVRYLIVSGDNSIDSYDEPTDMKQALMGRGVPAGAIYCDYAGFRTLDSVVRAKAVFQQDRIVVVSQRFQNERAIYLAQCRGIDAVGFNAADVSMAGGFKTRLREQAARVKAWLDARILHTHPKFYGPVVPLGRPQAVTND